MWKFPIWMEAEKYPVLTGALFSLNLISLFKFFLLLTKWSLLNWKREKTGVQSLWFTEREISCLALKKTFLRTKELFCPHTILIQQNLFVYCWKHLQSIYNIVKNSFKNLEFEHLSDEDQMFLSSISCWTLKNKKLKTKIVVFNLLKFCFLRKQFLNKYHGT